MTTIQVFISGLSIGFLLGMLVYYAFHQMTTQTRAQKKTQEIDTLIDDFHELFRQIDQGRAQDS